MEFLKKKESVVLLYLSKVRKSLDPNNQTGIKLKGESLDRIANECFSEYGVLWRRMLASYVCKRLLFAGMTWTCLLNTEGYTERYYFTNEEEAITYTPRVFDYPN